jgi:AbrB family looped-hinge helix DNA binding protein
MRRTMAKLATTKMSSKGQVVIPEEIRENLGLKAGAQFVVVGKDDVVILKSIETPTMSAFDDIIAEARKQARAVGLKRADIAKALKEVRARR